MVSGVCCLDHLYMVSPSKVVQVPINKNGEFGEEEKLFDLYGGGTWAPLIDCNRGWKGSTLGGNFARTPSYENQEYQPTGKMMSYLRIMPTDTTETAKHYGGWILKFKPDGWAGDDQYGYRNPCDLPSIVTVKCSFMMPIWSGIWGLLGIVDTSITEYQRERMAGHF